MIRILVIVPYKELHKLIDTAISQADTTGMDITTTHIFGTDLHAVEPLDAYDIIVARGLTCDAIGKLHPKLHLIEFNISSSDLISALWASKHDYGPRPVAILVVDGGICNPKELEDLVGMPIKLVQVSQEQDAVLAIERLSREGSEVFIGGLTVCRACEERGLPAVHIKTGTEAAVRAITEAINAARVLNRERTKSNLLATVLNNTRDAMIAVSSAGDVMASNIAANHLFGRTMLQGSSVQHFYPDAQWMSTMDTGVELEIIQEVNGVQMLVSQVPILVDSQSVGVLITLQNIEQLRETEHKIRTELHKKGLGAKYHFSNILCEDPHMRSLIMKSLRYSQVDGNVFIIGETGTGKELFAQSIHNASKRSDQPFVAVNCAALPEQLLESELFGYTDGAFSGAAKGGKQGLFELAHKGTIFLDEIGEMPLRLQAKILRVLQEHEIRKIGGDQVVPVDVRVISATNININEQLRNGTFRSDLFYRINLLSIAIPPLRERQRDIGIIFRHFITYYSNRFGQRIPRVTEGAVRALEQYSWPGNIRELRNCAERMVVLDARSTIDEQDIMDSELGDYFLGHQNSAVTASHAVASGEAWNKMDPGKLHEQFIRSNMSREAFCSMTGISRTTLWRKFASIGK